MSGFEAERAAIEAKFATGWANRTPVAFDNSKFIPPTAGAWVRLTIVPGDSIPASLGIKHIRNLGRIIVQIFVPEDSGTRQARQLADNVAGIFQYQKFSGISSGPANLAKIGESGAWMQWNVSISYRRDEFLS